MVGIIFYFTAGIIIISAILVVTLRNILHSALFLILCLIGVAGIYIILRADFFAAAQILVYVGGIMVLMLFTIMLTQKVTNTKFKQTNEQWFKSIVICGFILCTIIFAIPFAKILKLNSLIQNTGQSLPATTISLGKLLFGEYVLPFEVISLVLISALIGAVVFTRENKK
ncbi:MAG: NADH-quinone oxidoreductase subunit J [Elusimicrobia bacterium]|nr:NADH-quinone oxidoreductase subunit J [Elusimicrobiota bacterium]